VRTKNQAEAEFIFNMRSIVVFGLLPGAEEPKNTKQTTSAMGMISIVYSTIETNGGFKKRARAMGLVCCKNELPRNFQKKNVGLRPPA
jgi:hypothetical protein